MGQNRLTAVSAGIFFIIATAMGVLNAGMIGPLIGSATFLTGMAESADLVMVSVLLNTIMAGSVVAIAVALYPVLKRTSETLAIGYLAARIMEGIVLGIGGIIWLALVSLGHGFVEAGTPEASHYQALGGVLVSLSTSAFTLGAEIVFGVSALVLNALLFKATLVPKWIAIWGFIGGALLLTLGVMKIVGLPFAAVEIAFTAPIALNEMVLAIWLIFKGLNLANLE